MMLNRFFFSFFNASVPNRQVWNMRQRKKTFLQQGKEKEKKQTNKR